MIEAAVQAAKGKGRPPPRLAFAWWCLKYHTLPNHLKPLPEQVYREMYLNDLLPAVYDAVSNWRNGTATPAEYKTILWLARLRAM